MFNIKLFFFLLAGIILGFVVTNSVSAGHCNVSYQNSGCSYVYTGGCDSSDPSDPDCSECSGSGTASDGMVCATSPNSCDFSSCTASNTITKCSGGSCSDSSTVGHPWSVCSGSTASCTAPPPPPPPAPPVAPPPPPGSITCYRCVNGNAYCESYQTTDSNCSTSCNSCQAAPPVPAPPAPPPAPPPSYTAQCIDIRIYDTSWNRLSNPATMVTPGMTIRIAVSGNTNEPGGLTAARFKVNSTNWEQTTVKGPGGEFYIEKTVAAGGFSVEAQVFNPALGWK